MPVASSTQTLVSSPHEVYFLDLDITSVLMLTFTYRRWQQTVREDSELVLPLYVKPICAFEKVHISSGFWRIPP